MRLTHIFGLLIAAHFFIGCSGETNLVDSPQHANHFTALYGSPTSGVAVGQSSQEVQVNFSELGSKGRFIRISLPTGQEVLEETWSQDEQTLHMIMRVADGIEIGISPLRDFSGQVVSTTLRIGQSGKSTTTPPQGFANVVTDLLVTPLPDQRVELGWTQVNAGDYDFNGEVNIADLAPLGGLLGQTVDRTSPQSRLMESYWVDGDKNGEINLGDLAPIGCNYSSQIAGYIVRQNGRVLAGTTAGGPTILSQNGLKRPNLPTKYSLILSGSPDDFWEVSPVDSDGLSGSNNAGHWHAVSLKINLDIDGIGLTDFHDPELLGGLEPNSYRLNVLDLPELLRRLDPGIMPNGYHIGDIFNLGVGSAVFADLPRGQSLILEVQYKPEHNLKTGEPWSEADLAAGTNLVRTYFPFILPATGMLELDANIRVDQQLSGGALVGLETIVRSDSGTEFVDKQLDYELGLISQDTDLDASFTDEAHLVDEARMGLSLSQLNGLVDFDNNQYNAKLKQTIAGRLTELKEGTGTLTLADASTTDSGGTWPIGDVTVYFDETTNFAQLLLDPSGQVLDDIAPSAFNTNDYMCLEVDYLIDSIGEAPDRHWASTVRRKNISVDEDALAILPGTLIARPGEAVSITVFANKTAHPFYKLEGMGLSMEAGNYYRPGSFNAGELGGASNATDGLWQLLGAKSVNLPPDTLIVEEPFTAGRVLLDFALSPQDGHEITFASGALFNFELICHQEVTLQVVREHEHARTYYSDLAGNSYFWGHDEDALIPVIAISGDPLELLLTTPPASGSGTPDDPYQTISGTSFSVRLIDPLAGNVTNEFASSFTIEPEEAATVDQKSATLQVQSGFTGTCHVSASYSGIYTNPELGLSFLVIAP